MVSSRERENLAKNHWLEAGIETEIPSCVDRGCDHVMSMQLPSNAIRTVSIIFNRVGLFFVKK